MNSYKFILNNSSSLTLINRSNLIQSTYIKRCIHSTTTKTANPLPHPATPGPPPSPPTNTTPYERVERKRNQLNLLKAAKAIKDSNNALASSPLNKRFWKYVSIDKTPHGYQILLDTRPVRKSDRSILYIPITKPHLATAIGIEWDTLKNAQQALKSHYIPLTSLVSRAQDLEVASREIKQGLANLLLRYLHTDTILCWAPEPDIPDPSRESLRSTQMKLSKPIISYLQTKVWPGISIVPSLDEGSILPKHQDQETVAIIKSWIMGLNGWELAGLERATFASKSLLISSRLVFEWAESFKHLKDNHKSEWGIEDAVQVANAEVIWQTEQWGEVEDTHDVEKEDIRRQLGSTILLING